MSDALGDLFAPYLPTVPEVAAGSVLSCPIDGTWESPWLVLQSGRQTWFIPPSGELDNGDPTFVLPPAVDGAGATFAACCNLRLETGQAECSRAPEPLYAPEPALGLLIVAGALLVVALKRWRRGADPLH